MGPGKGGAPRRGWWIVDADGAAVGEFEPSPTAAAATAPYPPSLVPGSFWSDRPGEWYLVVDVTLWWDGQQWRNGGTVARLPDPPPPEPDIYAWRLRMLKQFGWVA